MKERDERHTSDSEKKDLTVKPGMIFFHRDEGYDGLVDGVQNPISCFAKSTIRHSAQ